MSAAGNLTLAIVGELIVGAVFIVVIRSVRRVVRRPPETPVRVIATIQRTELPAPPPKELTR